MVRILDNLTTGIPANIEPFLNRVEFVEGDIRNPVTARRAMHGMEIVFHQAAEASVPRSIIDPLGTYEVNVPSTLNILIAARDAGCQRVVFASSSAVYGNDPRMPKTEEMLADIARQVGHQVEAVYEPARAGDVPHSLADITTARERLGYDVTVPFDEGLRRFITPTALVPLHG